MLWPDLHRMGSGQRVSGAHVDDRTVASALVEYKKAVVNCCAFSLIGELTEDTTMGRNVALCLLQLKEGK